MIAHFIFLAVALVALVGLLYNIFADYSNGEEGMSQAIGAFFFGVLFFVDALAWIIYAIIK